MSNEIAVVFQNGLNYDYHFTIKELGNKFEGKFECLGENTGKCKDGNESVVTISYKRKFIDGARFMVISLGILVCNLTDGNYKIKCTDCSCFLEYESVNYNSIKYKCLSCNRDYSIKIDEELRKVI